MGIMGGKDGDNGRDREETEAMRWQRRMNHGGCNLFPTGI